MSEGVDEVARSLRGQLGELWQERERESGLHWLASSDTTHNLLHDGTVELGQEMGGDCGGGHTHKEAQYRHTHSRVPL